MTLITSEIKNGTLFLYPHGRIDTNNSAEAANLVEEARSSFDGDCVVMDGEELTYISSAGLRVILRLRKEIPGFRIINLQPDVYDIFDMTGFTEMMPVEKAYRKVSIDGCEMIGRGANGEVYRLDEETILKVYLNPDSLPDIQRERELARKAFVAGVPTAISYDVVRVGERYGSVFELLNARSLTELIEENPDDIEEPAKIYVDLLKKIHSTEVKQNDMPDMKQKVLGWVDFLAEHLDSEKWKKLHSLVEAIPECCHMIHGDYHTKNVLVQNGEALLIDMDTLAYGDPVFEFASIFNAFLGFYSINDEEKQPHKTFIGLDYGTSGRFWQRTLELYFDHATEEELKTVKQKAALLGYARLMRREIRRDGYDSEAGKKKIAFYRREIEFLTDQLDNLSLAQN